MTDIEQRQKLLKYIYKDVDGFYYFFPEQGQGAYSAYTLRLASDLLDEMNAEWNAVIAADINIVKGED